MMAVTVSPDGEGVGDEEDGEDEEEGGMGEADSEVL